MAIRVFEFSNRRVRLAKDSFLRIDVESSNVLFLDRRFPTVEHALLAARSMDPADHRAIAQASSLRRARELGAAITWVRPFWNKCRVGIMLGLLEHKYTPYYIRRQLMETHPRPLVYRSEDTFWGVNREGEGENRLGILLMIVRDNLRKGKTRVYSEFQAKQRQKIRHWRMKNATLRRAGLPHAPLTEAKKRSNAIHGKKRWESAKTAKRLNKR